MSSFKKLYKNRDSWKFSSYILIILKPNSLSLRWLRASTFVFSELIRIKVKFMWQNNNFERKSFFSCYFYSFSIYFFFYHKANKRQSFFLSMNLENIIFFYLFGFDSHRHSNNRKIFLFARNLQMCALKTSSYQYNGEILNKSFNSKCQCQPLNRNIYFQVEIGSYGI